jgi:hypothetical protein
MRFLPSFDEKMVFFVKTNAMLKCLEKNSNSLSKKKQPIFPANVSAKIFLKSYQLLPGVNVMINIFGNVTHFSQKVAVAFSSALTVIKIGPFLYTGTH